MPTQDCCQNLLLSSCLHCPILLRPFISSLTIFLYSLWQCAFPCYIWNKFMFHVPSSWICISLPYVYICYNWSTSASHSWNCHLTFWCPWAVLALHILFLYLSCNLVILPWTHIPVPLMLSPPFTPWVSLVQLWVGNPKLSWLCSVRHSSSIKKWHATHLYLPSWPVHWIQSWNLQCFVSLIWRTLSSIQHLLPSSCC